MTVACHINVYCASTTVALALALTLAFAFKIVNYATRDTIYVPNTSILNATGLLLDDTWTG
jgi:hypothetical protein